MRELLPRLRAGHRIDFVIANAENAAGGKGLIPRVADELFQTPVDVLTAGNHIWEDETIHPYFDTHPILRPLNVHESLPGRGFGIFTTQQGFRIAVVSLQGVVFMEEKGKKASDPFRAMDALILQVSGMADAIVVDFHAEATSEKRALAWYLDGRIAAFVGTHTHVQTADEHVLPGGTAYISDLGMTGPHESAVGMDKDVAIQRFLTGDKRKFKVAKGGLRLEGVVVEIDEGNGKALSIYRIQEKYAKV